MRTNPTQLVTFPHTISGCFLVAGALVAAVAMWHLIQRPAGADAASQSAATAFRSAAKVGAITVLVAAVFTTQQPTTLPPGIGAMAGPVPAAV